MVSLRDFVREALDLAPIPADLQIPPQGPTRPGGASGKGRTDGDAKGGRTGGGSGGGGMGAGMGGVGLGAGAALGAGHASASDETDAR